MDDSKSIIKNIFQELTFSEEETKLIVEKIKMVQLEKGTVVLEKGEIVLDSYFVIEGCLRTYFLDESGKEYTVQFAVNSWWISDYTAYYTSSEALLNIECIQNATLYKISRDDMEELYTKIPQIETFFRKKMEKAFATFQKRILSNLAKSARERYLDFVIMYPTIEQNIKNYHIASYLGITTESLSRIRKEISEK